MVQNKAKTRHNARQADGQRGPTRSIVVRMGAPEQLGFTINPDSSMMAALASGDMATRTAARAHFMIVTAQP
ncbi:hypothetical protein C3B59_05630 [Cryobacterium zongtaii]|uniref:Uncharacterized protein n=1 Tax=Cryobacterium zongtaii TaxID=1259217 RepID=A0A2S3ZLN7_9MICO|nr:hypothetical protein [Cryobacterium zongtaii]POH69370.1 hypothetical protein C3B59_05630 [Cryobacterium zongtaii]